MSKVDHRVTGNDLAESVLKGAVVFGADGLAVGEVTAVEGVGPHGTVTLSADGASTSVPTSSLEFSRAEKGPVRGTASWSKGSSSRSSRERVLPMSDGFIPYALIVDDEPLIRMNAVDILDEAGFRTREAASGDAALEVLEEAGSSIQLLFTDVQMPGSVDGFALARECAKRWPHVSIVVSSGARTPEPDDLPPEAVFIGKPFSADVVYGRLQEILPDGQKPATLKERS